MNEKELKKTMRERNGIKDIFTASMWVLLADTSAWCLFIQIKLLIWITSFPSKNNTDRGTKESIKENRLLPNNLW